VPIAVKAADAVAIAVAMTVVVVRPGYAKDAVYCAHGTADPGADRTSHEAADGTRHPTALIRALLSTPNDALGMAGAGHGHQRQCEGKKGKDEWQRPAAGKAGALDLGVSHLEFLEIRRESPT
jgi:hypothetical protein